MSCGGELWGVSCGEVSCGGKCSGSSSGAVCTGMMCCDCIEPSAFFARRPPGPSGRQLHVSCSRCEKTPGNR